MESNIKNNDKELFFASLNDFLKEENGIKGVLRKCKTPLFESKNDRFV